MMKAFEDARTATEELFENYPDDEQTPIDDAVQAQEAEEQIEQPTEDADVPTEPTEGDGDVPTPTPEETTLDNAVNTAEVAAQVAQERDMQLQQVLQELEAVKAQNQQMQGTINELSQKNEEKLIEEAMQPPVLDINGLAFADEATIAQAHADFAQKMADYNRQQIMKELEPTLAYAKKGMQDEERSQTLSALSQVPELQGINDMLPQLDKIIANNKWLQSEDMPMDEKYINAFAIARGVNAINTPPVEQKEPTAEELMELYDKNPTFQELIEKKRLDAIKNSQQVPPFSAYSP